MEHGPFDFSMSFGTRWILLLSSTAVDSYLVNMELVIRQLSMSKAWGSLIEGHGLHGCYPAMCISVANYFVVVRKTF